MDTILLVVTASFLGGLFIMWVIHRSLSRDDKEYIDYMEGKVLRMEQGLPEGDLSRFISESEARLAQVKVEHDEACVRVNEKEAEISRIEAEMKPFDDARGRTSMEEHDLIRNIRIAKRMMENPQAKWLGGRGPMKTRRRG